jgi:hypothetical protein
MIQEKMRQNQTRRKRKNVGTPSRITLVTVLGVGVDQITRIRPSWWHCLWGLPFFLIGGGFFVYTIFHGIMHLTDSLTQIVIPGSTELNLQRGRYSVFLEEESIVNGKIYSTTQSIDGLACRISSVQNGAAVAIEKASTSASYSVNGRSGHSILEFPIQQDGRYAFACDYGENSKGPEVVVAVGSGVSEAIFRTVIGSLAAFFGGCGAGLIVVLVVVFKREREKKLLRQSGQVQI